MIWFIAMTLVSSIDCIFAGMSYSVRKIRIPFLSKFLLFMTALIVGCIAQLASNALVQVIPESISHSIGKIILLILGSIMFFNALHEPKSKPAEQENSVATPGEVKTLFKLAIKSAGITIHVLKDPRTADLDQSGRIDPLESILLSLALTLDSMGLILSGTLMHKSSLLLPLMLGIGQILGLIYGEKLGLLLMKRINNKLIRFVPSVLLITIAFISFI